MHYRSSTIRLNLTGSPKPILYCLNRLRIPRYWPECTPCSPGDLIILSQKKHFINLNLLIIESTCPPMWSTRRLITTNSAVTLRININYLIFQKSKRENTVKKEEKIGVDGAWALSCLLNASKPSLYREMRLQSRCIFDENWIYQKKNLFTVFSFMNLFVLSFFIQSSFGKNERELYDTIFRNYSKDIRPTKQANLSVQEKVEILALLRFESLFLSFMKVNLELYIAQLVKITASRSTCSTTWIDLQSWAFSPP